LTTASLFDPDPPDSDRDARRAIAEELDETLFVEAGAGAGKTAALVDRVVALVAAGTPIREIAAITFTEKAAAELLDRVRAQLEVVARGPQPSATAAAVALAELDDAAIGTLHAFAQRLLVEHPIEVGLPPAIEVLDEVSSQLAFDERWSRVYDALLADPTMEPIVLLALGAGIRQSHLRELARIANDNWDLVGERMTGSVEPPGPVEVDVLVDAIRAVTRRRGECAAPDDRLLPVLDELDEYADSLAAARDDTERLEWLRAEKPTFRANNKGRQQSWRDIGSVRAEIGALATLRDQILADCAERLLRALAMFVARFTLDAAGERRRDGRLEFHDLLVLARSLLRDPVHGAAVRAQLARHYRRLLLDEFQDTDPIQIELAVLLTSDDPEAASRPWPAVVPEPGRLFVVGDPKQSIYRFRRADVATFLTARTSIGGRILTLSRNFRSSGPVIDWINAVFADLIVFRDGVQPEFQPLTATRAAPPAGPPVVLLGTRTHTGTPTADELRRREAADVVRAIRTAIGEQWSVADESGGGWRAARLGDVCVLLPSRLSLPHLEQSLDVAAIPYRAETSSLVYTTREVRDLMMALRAVDDPSDQLALVSTLRTALYGCGDDDLFDYRVTHRGAWSLFAPRPDALPGDHPVVEALDHLRSLHDDRHWRGPSEVLERLVRDRRVLEQGFATGRPRDLWRRVRFVIDQARAFGDAGGGTLRDYLRWAEQQAAESARVVESVLPETDDDAVRILTVHGAKGLEFPIVILSGATTAAAYRSRGVRLVFPPGGGYGVRFRSGMHTEEFERFKPIDEQMDFEEKLRLLYVAATRARDHLVVSVHRRDRALPSDRRNYTHAELLWSAAEQATGRWTELPDGARRPRDQRGDTGARPASAVAPWAHDAWDEELRRALAAARRPRSISATAIARAAAERDTDPGLQKEPRDLELPPWQRGRYGTAIGRAVHAVLQTIDLTDDTQVDAAALAQAGAEGVLGQEGRIAALVRSALASRIVRAAVASGAYWRESYVATTIDGRIVEGYIDLVYRRPAGAHGAAGLVVVDYKTDSVGSPADVAARVDRYRLQGAAYALAVGRATSEPVAAVVFVFCDPAGATEVEVASLDAAVAEVDALVRA
jgi:ATP-dependent exoDNAse (exonuclease V) beta subunit